MPNELVVGLRSLSLKGGIEAMIALQCRMPIFVANLTLGSRTKLLWTKLLWSKIVIAKSMMTSSSARASTTSKTEIATVTTSIRLGKAFATT